MFVGEKPRGIDWLAVAFMLAVVVCLCVVLRLTVHPCAFVEPSDFAEWAHYDCATRRAR